MTTDQLDDPVSCSALAGSLRRHAAVLRAAVREAEAASQAAADGWPGRVSVQHRRTAGDLATRAWELAGAMDRAGLALATHAADLAQVRTDRAGLVANPALGDEERAERERSIDTRAARRAVELEVLLAGVTAEIGAGQPRA